MMILYMEVIRYQRPSVVVEIVGASVAEGEVAEEAEDLEEVEEAVASVIADAALEALEIVMADPGASAVNDQEATVEVEGDLVDLGEVNDLVASEVEAVVSAPEEVVEVEEVKEPTVDEAHDSIDQFSGLERCVYIRWIGWRFSVPYFVFLTPCCKE